MTALIGWLIGGAGQIVAGILVALITALGLYAKGRADAAARQAAKSTRAALDAERKREEIDDAIREDTDLVKRARDVGLLRPDR